MAKFMGLLLVIAAVYGGYWYAFHQSPAYRQYLGFVSTIRKGDCPSLTTLTEGQARSWVDQYCGFGEFAGKPAAAKYVAELSGSPAMAMQHFKRRIESEDEAEDGSVTLVVIEHVMARPSNFSSPAPDMRQKITLKPVGDAWKVTAWSEGEVKE